MGPGKVQQRIGHSFRTYRKSQVSRAWSPLHWTLFRLWRPQGKQGKNHSPDHRGMNCTNWLLMVHLWIWLLECTYCCNQSWNWFYFAHTYREMLGREHSRSPCTSHTLLALSSQPLCDTTGGVHNTAVSKHHNSPGIFLLFSLLKLK